MYRKSSHNNILGIILMIAGGFSVFLAVGEFIFRIAIALFGLYLIYNGLRLRNQHRQMFFFFQNFNDRFGRR